MPQYMVERHLPDFPPDDLPGAAAAAKEKSAELSAEGQEDVSYLRSTYIPEGEKCYCLFEGSSREAVEEVQKRAGLPFERIHEAAFLTSDDV